MFELNREYGIFKFVVIVPTLSIKAGTIDFLNSESARVHFKEQYSKVLKLHIVESKKGSKSKKQSIPPSVVSFVEAGAFDKYSIQVLVINTGMINSDTMQKHFDRTMFDEYDTAFDAIASTRPWMIIDEPHKFVQVNKTWENIERIKAQLTFRYGATFPEKEVKYRDGLGGKISKKVKDYHHLIYTLTAVDAFNGNLVKGVIGHTIKLEGGTNALVKFVNSDGKEAIFELTEGRNKKTFKVIAKGSLETVHGAMSGLLIEKINKTTVLLSNGLALKKGDKINPYSYATTLQQIMLEKAIKNHFKLEKQYLTRAVRIKPLSLFFIDNIEEYRGENGAIRTTVESLIKAEVEALLKTEKHIAYRAYLEKTLANIPCTHGGYFSKDNSEKDEVIEKEINEILHDKQAMLDLDNPRRFIFSKWTLREGWDNPNVFQICKIRSSGSDISKLQEVGRGLRLPVNEYGNRVKGSQFYLDYFVDFTESDFIDKLASEINQKSGAISAEGTPPSDLHAEMIKQITERYDIGKEALLKLLDDKEVINRSNVFKKSGFDYIKTHYPLIFDGVNPHKIRRFEDVKKKVSIRTEKYRELQALWEKINEKVILEYKFENEEAFKTMFVNFLQENNGFAIEGFNENTQTIVLKDKVAGVAEESVAYDEPTPLPTMKYSDFLKALSGRLTLNLKTLHQAFIESNIALNPHLNHSTISVIQQKFQQYLMHNAITNFSIGYQKVSNDIHPTKFTNEQGEPLAEIAASDVGVKGSEDSVSNNYLRVSNALGVFL
jgi:type III restriction enzyme